MKQLLLLLLLGLSACNGCAGPQESSVDAEATEAPSTPIAPAPAPPNPTAEPLPPPVKDTTVTAVEVDRAKAVERAKTSEMADKECCDILAINQCCCDETLATYESHLKKNDLDAALNMEAKDRFYPACALKFKNFEPSIVALQEKYLGE